MRHHDPHVHYSYYCSQAGRGYNSFSSSGTTHQFGGAQPSFNVFRGVPSQRGYGILSNVIRRFGVPLISYLAPKILAKGKEIASDIYLRDRSPREAIRARLKEGGRELLRDTLNKAANYTNNHFGQEGAGQRLHFIKYNLRSTRGVKRKRNSTKSKKTGVGKRRKRTSKRRAKGRKRRPSKRSKRKKKKTVSRSSKVNIFV